MEEAGKNRCYTYFKITGTFEPDDITEILNLSPIEQWRIGDVRRTGSKFEFAMWRFGLCEDYDVYVDEQMMVTIKDLIPKTAELREIKKTFDVAFTLEIVPTIYPGERVPCLAPNRDVIKFCYETETDIDIDLYVDEGDDDDE